MHLLHLPEVNRPRSSTGVLSLAGFTLLAVVQLYSSPVAAEENDPDSSHFALGIGVKSEKTPYKGRDRENQVLPLIQYENRYIEIFGPGIAFRLPELDISDSQQINFSIVGEFDGSSGYKDDDAKSLAGMHKRKSSFWAGGRMTWKTELVDVTTEWLGDVSGNSKGMRVNLSLEHSWQFGQHLMLTPRLDARWYDRKYIDYYFGVRKDEIRADRAAYSGKSGINAGIGVQVAYMFGESHSLIMDMEASGLSSAIKDSPLVDQSNQNNIMFGYIYRF